MKKLLSLALVLSLCLGLLSACGAETPATTTDAITKATTVAATESTPEATTPQSSIDALDGKKKGETVDVLVLRDGKKQEIQVVLYQDATVKNMSDTSSIFFSLGLVVQEQDAEGKTEILRYCSLESASARDGFFQTIGHSFMYSIKLGGSVLRSLGE